MGIAADNKHKILLLWELVSPIPAGVRSSDQLYFQTQDNNVFQLSCYLL